MRNFTSRKFLVAMYFGTMVGVECWYGKIPGIAAASAIAGIAAIYKAANAYESAFGQEYNQAENH